MLSDTTSPGQWRKQAPLMNVTMAVGGVLQDYVAAAAECRSRGDLVDWIHKVWITYTDIKTSDD